MFVVLWMIPILPVSALIIIFSLLCNYQEERQDYTNWYIFRIIINIYPTIFTTSTIISTNNLSTSFYIHDCRVLSPYKNIIRRIIWIHSINFFFISLRDCPCWCNTIKCTNLPRCVGDYHKITTYMFTIDILYFPQKDFLVFA